MNEKNEEIPYSFARDYLHKFFEELYLVGEPKAGRVYIAREIAKAGSQYLQRIGVDKLPDEYQVTDIEALLRKIIWTSNPGSDEQAENTPLVLGLVVGTALFNPESRLDEEQKAILMRQSIGALQRAYAVEGEYRGAPTWFADVVATCAEQYGCTDDVDELRAGILEEYVSLVGEISGPPSQDRKRSKGFGKRVLDALGHVPGAPIIHPDPNE